MSEVSLKSEIGNVIMIPIAATYSGAGGDAERGSRGWGDGECGGCGGIRLRNNLLFINLEERPP